MPVVRQGRPLNPAWWAGAISIAAGVALTSYAELLGRWCADPVRGWLMTLGLGAAGAGVVRLLQAPDDDGARVWSIAAALLTTAVLVILRVLGLGLASPEFLQNPLGNRTLALFVLGQAIFVSAAAAAAWTQCVRSKRSRSAILALFGAAGAKITVGWCEPSVLLALSAVAAMLSSVVIERPWNQFSPTPVRTRGFLLASALVLAGALQSPGLLRDVWTSRLHMAYPGGRFLSLRDDGSYVWGGYQYSDFSRVALRDGVIQSWEPETLRHALRELLGQANNPASILIIDPPDPRSALLAEREGVIVWQEFASAAQRAVVDVLGEGKDGGQPFAAASATDKPSAALIFVPRPLHATSLRSNVTPRALENLRRRLATNAPIAVLIAPDASGRSLRAIETAVRRTFGQSRTIDLPNRSACVIGSPLVTN